MRALGWGRPVFPAPGAGKTDLFPLARSGHPGRKSFGHLRQGLFPDFLSHWPARLSVWPPHTAVIPVPLGWF